MHSRWEILHNLENSYPVNSIQVNGESFWPFFRLLIFSKVFSDVIQVHRKSHITPLIKARNALFGITNWRRTWDYVMFSNEQERKTVDGRSFDKLTEYTTELLGFEKSLYVEHVEKNHLSKSSYEPKNVSSFDFILILSGLSKFLSRKRKVQIENEGVLRQILADLGISIDYEKKLAEFLSKVRVLQKVFKSLKPRIIFITDYGNMAVIYAAKSLPGIKTVEFQHGVIGMAHAYYHPSERLDKKFCPDFLLVFGTHDLESLSHGRYVDAKQIFPIGNFFLDQIKELPLRKKVLQILEPFKKAVCVPTDRITHKYLMQFIKDIAAKLPEYIFIVVPRSQGYLEAADRNLPANIHIETEFSFQDIVRHCSINSCTNSTCCLEALTLGVPNILIDEDGLTSAYYAGVLTNPETTKFARTKQEYIALLKNHTPIPREEIMYSNLRNYMPNYRDNLQLALNEIGL